MNSSWFRLSFIINNEQIEPNLNGGFANKYDKIQCCPRNFDTFQEILIIFKKFWIVRSHF